MEKKLLIFININNKDVLLGTVFVDDVKGKETYSFEYSEEALSNNYSKFIIDEDITFAKGRQFKLDSSSPYHFLEDSSPDRWGRNLIKRNAGNKSLFFSDYLLAVSDVTRMGALRYKLNDSSGPFLEANENVPPLKFLSEFENIAYHYNEFDLKEDWKLLLLPGSSLGGARPKATLYDGNGNYYLAKFNHKNDEYDVSKVEYLTYRLAVKSGIEMADSRLIPINTKRSVFLTKRFDRENGQRYHYVSFMTLLNAKDGESSDHSYLEVAEALLEISDQPQRDLEQLYKRIAFSIIFHNYDNHLRNHGMILKNNKWQLSPCFDINISPYPGRHVLTIDGGNATIESLIDNAGFFRLTKEAALAIVDQMVKAAKMCLVDYCKELNINKGLMNKLEKAINLK